MSYPDHPSFLLKTSGSNHSRRLLGVCSLLLLHAAGCVGENPTRDTKRSTGDVAEENLSLSWLGDVVLQETSDVINVAPIVFAEGDQFLVVDSREAQVRQYGRDGALRWYFGRRGAGPGEFQNPYVALRLEADKVLVAETNGRVTVLDVSSPGAPSLEKTFRLDLDRIESGAQIGRGEALLTGITGELLGPRIHVLDLQRESIIRSFFAPPAGKDPGLGAVFGFTIIDLYGDTIAAVTPMSDSVYLYRTSGERLKAVPLPRSLLRLPVPAPPDVMADPRKRAEWLGSFDVLSSVYWLTPDRLLVQYRKIINMQPQWHLLVVSLEGTLLFQAHDTPRLLTVFRESGSLVFVSPESEAPNRWSIATLR